MSATIDIIENAKAPTETPVSQHNAAFQGYGLQDNKQALHVETLVVEHGLLLVSEDIEAGLSERVIKALSNLKTANDPRYLSLRPKFKRANADIRLADLDRMVSRVQPSEDEDGCDTGGGIVESIITTVQSMGELFTDSNDVAFIRYLADDHYETRLLDSKDFRQWIAHQYHKEHGRAPKTPQLQDAFTTLAGYATHEGETYPVYKRVARDEHGYLLDLGDEGWRAIRLSPAGYEVIEQSPVRFRRPAGAMSLFVPETGGTLDDLLALVNIKPEDAVMLVAVLCETLRPDTAYPVVEFGGEQGSGKSANQSNIRRLLDPKDVALRSEPKSTHDIFIAATNNHIVSYNNLSRLSPEFQDALCSLSTGGGFAGRRLYSNDEEATFEAKTSVFMNGIIHLATQPDLISRVAYFQCPKITNRISDSELAEILQTRGPKALDFILTTFCKALALLPSIRITDPPRLMDFALLGEAVALVMGKDAGYFTRGYQAALDDAAEQSIEGVPVIEALAAYVKRRQSIDSTVGQLFDSLTRDLDGGRPSAWPKSSRGFRESLDRYSSAMHLMGIEITYPPGRRNGQKIHISFSGQKNSLPETPSPPSPKPAKREGGELREDENSKVNLEPRKEKTGLQTITPSTAPPEIRIAGTEGRF